MNSTTTDSKQDLPGYLQTGQLSCHDAAGNKIDCQGTGQDAAFRKGIRWPERRFIDKGEIVLDTLSGLTWSKNANLAEFPLTWQETFDFITQMNHEQHYGYNDWRLPNRRELRSLISHQTRAPALPEAHPFEQVFPGWYWTSTSAAISPAHAWYVHMEGARMFYGGKDQSFFTWPVRDTGNGNVLATGQLACYDSMGKQIPCQSTGQDGDYRAGRQWPVTRFVAEQFGIHDRLTGLCWRREADITNGPVSWQEALDAVEIINAGNRDGVWRLPNINELESLVDCSASGPALPAAHPFRHVCESYWSSTTSMFEPDWAWALYLDKGAVGVGQKSGKHFHVWPVRDGFNVPDNHH
jgi:hypothetical protein